MISVAKDLQASRYRAGWTFVLSAAWIVALVVASLVLVHVLVGPYAALLQAVAILLLSFAGFYWIALRRVADARPLTAVGFARRPSQGRELLLGMALGWGIAIAMVVPALLTRNLHTLVSPDRIHAGQTLYGVALVVAVAVATQVIASGLVFRSLVRATSPGRAVLSVALLVGVSQALQPGHVSTQAIFSAAASVLFSVAALRTRAIWLGIGMQAAWGVALTALFGVGSFYWPTAGGVVTSYVTGSRVLTGSNLGPEASVWGLMVVAAGVPVLWRVTRDYAWHYAHDPIAAAGYPMDVAPPVEHARMEEQAARKPAPLVQIQGLPTASEGNPEG